MKAALKEKCSGIRAMAVYCGASMPNDSSFVEAVAAFGHTLADLGITLVFGGSNAGTMKVLADAVQERGGKVVGVFTKDLPMETLRPGMTLTVMTDTLAKRKASMLGLADAVVALPGGFGTWDELFDAAELRKMKKHRKPLGILNINGYFDPLLQFIEKAVELGLVGKRHRRLIKVGRTPEELLVQLAEGIPNQTKQP